jgi:hypothetical protein
MEPTGEIPNNSSNRQNFNPDNQYEGSGLPSALAAAELSIVRMILTRFELLLNSSWKQQDG